MTGKDGRMHNPAATLDKMEAICGRRPAIGRGSYRIVGGQIAQKHSWPWQVSHLPCLHRSFVTQLFDSLSLYTGNP